MSIRRQLTKKYGDTWWKGERQLEFLVSQGLLPGNTLLDVGCGYLRGGLHMIKYLDDGHYTGVDHWPKFIELGRQLAVEEGVIKKFELQVIPSSFEFSLRAPCDYAYAFGLFPHLKLKSIARCMHSITRKAKVFYAAFRGSAETMMGRPNRRYHHEVQMSYYTQEDMEIQAELAGCTIEFLPSCVKLERA